MYDYLCESHSERQKVAQKKKQGDFNFALESREGDFSQYRMKILPTSPGLVSHAASTLHISFK
jgi:hypothetical protein